MSTNETIIIGIGKFIDYGTKFKVDGVEFDLSDDFEKTDLLDKFRPETFKYKFQGYNGVNVEVGDGVLWVGRILEYQEAEGNPLSDFELCKLDLQQGNLEHLANLIQENLGISVDFDDLTLHVFKSYH